MIHAFKHFYFSELLRNCSRSEVDGLLKSKTNFPNLVNVVTLLDQMRDAYGCPIVVTSGYRDKDHNSRVNGSPTSQHMIGAAADIKLVKCYNSNYFGIAEFIYNNPELFGQVILYYPESEEKQIKRDADGWTDYELNWDFCIFIEQLRAARWIHVALPSANHKQLSISTKYINA